MQKKWISLLLALLMLMAFSSCSGEPPVMPEEQTTASPELQRPEPQQDFYGYINYDYLTTGQLPSDEDSYGTFAIIQDQLELDISALMDRCFADTSGDPFAEMVRELYQQYRDDEAREEAGADILLSAAAMVDGCKTTDELIDVLGVLYQQYGVCSMFRFDVLPDFYDTSFNRLMLDNMNTCGNMKENFTKTDDGVDLVGSLVRDTLVGMKVDDAQARTRAKAAVKMVYDIMVHAMDSEALIDPGKHYNVYSREQLAELLSNVDVNKLMDSFGLKVNELLVFDIDQVKQINLYFTNEHLQELKDYTMACIFNDYRDILPASLVESFGTSKNDDDPEKTAKKFVAQKLEDVVGVLYGREICTEEVMTAAETMTSDLRKSCYQLIQNSQRLSPQSKKLLLGKLDSIVFLLGDNKDYQPPFKITPAKDGGTLISNVIAVKVGNQQSLLAKLSEKGNRITWDMTAITVNAVYNPMVNTVTIPAVMLNKPSFDPSYGEYVNLGRLGYVIAHEMNHAFDSNGIKYNETGCYTPEWIAQEDRDAYSDIQAKAIALYSDYRLLDVYSIDGEATLSENLADLGAIQCALNITKDKEQQKQILQGAAEQWAELSVVSFAVEQLGMDIHSPGEARVNAVVSCMDEFYEIYDVKETDKMYVAPEKRVKVW